jgi:hypothetical protein
MIRFLTAALLATTMLGAIAPALAVTQEQADQHNVLIGTLERYGVRVSLDDQLCRERPIDGFYHSPSKTLTLCNGGSTSMTDANLDTLRHESIHAMQDCRNGIQGDRILGHVLKSGAAASMAAEYGISPERIRQLYLSHGVDEYTVTLEYEAFAGAAAMSADTIAQALDIFCSAAQ